MQTYPLSFVIFNFSFYDINNPHQLITQHRNVEEDTRRAIAELAEASQRRIAEREAEKRRVLENLRKENEEREVRHLQATATVEAENEQRLLAIKLDGEKTSLEREGELTKVREEYGRKKEEVLEINQDLEAQLDEMAEVEERRHQEIMKLYTTFQDSM